MTNICKRVTINSKLIAIYSKKITIVGKGVAISSKEITIIRKKITVVRKEVTINLRRNNNIRRKYVHLARWINQHPTGFTAMPDIGAEIARVMAQRGLTKTGLARLLGSHASTVTRILKNQETSNHFLLRLSKALRHNFFKLYVDELEKELPDDDILTTAKSAEKEVMELRKENADLKEKISYLKTIHELVMSARTPSEKKKQ